MPKPTHAGTNANCVLCHLAIYEGIAEAALLGIPVKIPEGWRMDMEIPLSEQLTEVKREIGLRHAVYARRVESGKMTSQEAKHKIEIMKAVQETISRAMRRSKGDG